MIGVVWGSALGVEVEADSQQPLTPTLSRRERELDWGGLGFSGWR